MVGHRHATEEKRLVAEGGTVLRVQVGSGVHGTAISGQDDRDEMGVCLEPPRYVTGIARPFDQYEWHSAWERAGGLRERSGAGDLDVVVYGARKWARLAASGNPTVLLPLYVPESEIVVLTPAGAELRANADRFVSRLAGGRFIGYLRAQRRAMTGESGAHTNRPELVAVHGYDVKFAMHALRLGVQGVELLSTGRLTLPIPEPHLSELRAVRRGERPLEHVLDRIAALDAELEALRTTSPLPEEPDYAWIDDWLHRSYTAFWGQGAATR